MPRAQRHLHFRQWPLVIRHFLLNSLVFALSASAAPSLHLHLSRPGFVSLNIHRPDGTVARRLLTGQKLSAGDHEIPWDGLADGVPLPPGDYTWDAVIHDGLSLQLRGWLGDWGGDIGVPNAVAADDDGVYLGWSLASGNADTVVACTTDGAIRWTHHRGQLSGCRALAADAGTLFVLGGESKDAAGATLYKLNAKTGASVPWSGGRTYITITSLWPVDGKQNGKPHAADYLAVKNGRIYLSFTAGDFISILDAATGAYIQTIVGTPPAAIAAVATKCDTPDEPGKHVDADFVVSAEQGGTLGKLLLVHDPIWVVASDLVPIDPAENITALAAQGDHGKYHPQEIFIALGPPANQVQVRSALDSDKLTCVAGEGGSRPSPGPWQPGCMEFIRAIALDATGRLWAAEADPAPRRISVWTTDTPVAHLAREFFAPPGPDAAAAINPRDPTLMIANGCEWRINPETGRGTCLGIVTRDPVSSARFILEKARTLLALTLPDGIESILERIAGGDYRPYTGPAPNPPAPKFQLRASETNANANTPANAGTPRTWQLTTATGFTLGTLFEAEGNGANNNSNAIKPATQLAITPPPTAADWPPTPETTGTPTLTEAPNGKIYLTAGATRTWNLELTGLATLRSLASGKITIPTGH